MRFSEIVMRSITSVDSLLAKASLKLTQESPGLISLMFHGLFDNRREALSGLLLPQQGTTLLSLRNCIKYFRDSGYHFVTPKEIQDSLNPNAKHILLTFDDASANNLKVLPLLQEFDVPAVFFVPTNHVKTQKSFWWDVAFRNSKNLGFSSAQFTSFCIDMQRKRTRDIEDFLKARLGEQIMTPIGDLDRPMTIDELKVFSSCRQVHIGNHTHDHAVLVNYSEQEIEEQIALCQQELKSITGQIPLMIAYPQGFFNERIIDIAKQQGLHLGVTCQPGKVKVPVTNQAMVIKRDILWENRDQIAQLVRFRSDSALYPFLFSLRNQYLN